MADCKIKEFQILIQICKYQFNNKEFSDLQVHMIIHSFIHSRHSCEDTYFNDISTFRKCESFVHALWRQVKETAGGCHYHRFITWFTHSEHIRTIEFYDQSTFFYIIYSCSIHRSWISTLLHHTHCTHTGKGPPPCPSHIGPSSWIVFHPSYMGPSPVACHTHPQGGRSL